MWDFFIIDLTMGLSKWPKIFIRPNSEGEGGAEEAGAAEGHDICDSIVDSLQHSLFEGFH